MQIINKFPLNQVLPDYFIFLSLSKNFSVQILKQKIKKLREEAGLDQRLCLK